MVQAERLAAIGQTIATLSHHIKNILQGIRGGSYLIEEGLKTTDTECPQGLDDRRQESGQDLQPGHGHAHVQQRTASPILAEEFRRTTCSGFSRCSSRRRERGEPGWDFRSARRSSANMAATFAWKVPPAQEAALRSNCRWCCSLR
jgi:hypothetical protein